MTTRERLRRNSATRSLLALLRACGDLESYFAAASPEARNELRRTIMKEHGDPRPLLSIARTLLGTEEQYQNRITIIYGIHTLLQRLPLTEDLPFVTRPRQQRTTLAVAITRCATMLDELAMLVGYFTAAANHRQLLRASVGSDLRSIAQKIADFANLFDNERDYQFFRQLNNITTRPSERKKYMR